MTIEKIRTTKASRAEAVADLADTTCRGCGGKKMRGHSHCRRCYFTLPQRMRYALYNPVGGGYEEAYTVSLQFLADRAPAK